MTVEYRPAFAAADIGADLIRAHHEHLLGVRVEYVFRSEAAKTRGRVVLGRARKVTGLNAWLAGDVDDETGVVPTQFFVVELAEDEWSRMSDRQRRALVDHELTHLLVEFDDDGTPKLGLRAHDLEEFVEIVRRHGLWKPDVDLFARASVEHVAGDVVE